MEKLFFIVKKNKEGGFFARSIGASIFTEADSLFELEKQIIDAIKCHFDDKKKRIIYLNI